MKPSNAPDYLNPAIPPGMARVKIPVLEADSKTIAGYGQLFDRPDDIEIEITRWPAQGWRPVDSDCGDEGGTTEGIFVSEWKGDILYGSNEAVGGRYILGYATEPEDADDRHQGDPESLLLWHANYHPDGGQLFFPQEKKPFLVPLAKPGDDVKPEDFVCFSFDGSKGLYIHPNIWHDGVFAVSGKHRFFDKQGAVHARVSVDFPREFGCLLEIPLKNN
ncbi:MAG: ureidoglycolate lyase [SAR324 cluster bacterium]|nr:ureidoglycolate lyase [SAR324 cluster bacterium]